MMPIDFLSQHIDPEFYLPIDYIFAEVLLRRKLSSKSAILFVMTLFALARKGHLCMRIMDEACLPSLPAISKEFYSLLQEGAKEITGSLIVEYKIEMRSINKPIVFYENHYYLQQNFLFEEILIKHIHSLETYEHFHVEKAVIDDFLQTSSLNSEQKMAIYQVFSTAISIVSGGPGRGKTYTASMIARIFLSIYANKKIIVTAPTGKATLRLQESININDPRITFSTLHSLLQIQPERSILEKPVLLGENLIIVDEASMIDIKLFAKLMLSTQNGTTLVFMGDENQLPPVEIGTVFSELCNYAKANSRIGYTLLHQCMRTDLMHILELSDKIRRGESIRDHCIPWGGNNVLDLLPHPFWKYARCVVFNEDPLLALHKLPEMQILSCLRQGDRGAISINKQIINRLFLHECKNRSICIPILVTKTSEHAGLINGEMGILVQYGLTPTAKDFALFTKADKKIVKISRIMLPCYEEAFAISVHKSQGSEFNSVIVLIGEGSDKFGREIIYTAITRAKKAIMIIADINSIEQCAQRTSNKYCRIYDRLITKKNTSRFETERCSSSL